MVKPVFVARERELAQLKQHLDHALASRSQICLVKGEAGSGKTALVTEFSRRAQEIYSDLVVAVGQGDVLMGTGSPYLPFREVLSQLTGDVEAKLAQGIISAENANRLRKFAVVSLQVMVSVAPNLIGLFLPGAKILADLGQTVIEKAGWLDELEELVRKGRPVDASDLNADQVYGQYADLLIALAEKQPLMLVLDDLQWADAGSTDLLNRLNHRLKESRVLIVGTYRPEEVAIGRAGGRHPLEGTVNLLKRTSGVVPIDLDEAKEMHRQHFVNAYLDSEPNCFGTGFRKALFRHTGGHPLFTIELLRAMQERGTLIRDDQGRWMVGAGVNWSALPVRVEGVIEERIGRLERELREILAVASVQGDVFAAEVIAHVQEGKVLRVLGALSTELKKRHRLVRELDEIKVGRQRLSRYCFAHALFRQFVYNELGAGERRLLHLETGEVLETLYGDRAESISVRLAYHFGQGEAWERNVHYLTRAGQQALDLFETDTARRFLEAAERVARTELADQVDDGDKLAYLEGLGDVYRTLGDFDESQRCFEAGLCLANSDKQRAARLYWKLAIVFERQSRYDDACRWLDLGLAALADASDADLMSRLHLQHGLICARQGDLDAAFEWATKDPAIESSQRHNLLAVLYRAREDLDKAAFHLERSIALCEANRDQANLLKAYGNQGVVYTEMDRWPDAIQSHRRALELSADLADAYMAALIRCNLSDLYRHQGNLGQALRYASESLERFEVLENDFGKAQAHLNWGAALLAAGESGEACRLHLQPALDLLHQVESQELRSEVERTLAEAHLKAGRLAEAEAFARQAIDSAIGQQARSDEGSSKRIFGLVLQAQGQMTLGRACLEESLDLLEAYGPRYELALTQLALARVCQAGGEGAAEAAQILDQARSAFQDLGARLEIAKVNAIASELDDQLRGK